MYCMLHASILVLYMMYVYTVCKCVDFVSNNGCYVYLIGQYLLTIPFHYHLQTVVLDHFVLVGVTHGHSHWMTHCKTAILTIFI